ncbi:MAG: prefoldin subunit alpha [Candidatus Kariarchaeaceae archaeon]
MTYPVQPPEEYRANNVQEVYNQYQAAVRQLQYYETQETQISGLIEDLSANIRTIEGIESYSKGSEIIIPLGGMILLKAKLLEVDEILVNIGSEVVAPISAKDAKDLLASRVNEMTEVLNRIFEDRKKLEEVASQLQTQLNQISQQG